jgi:hypothetical protein
MTMADWFAQKRYGCGSGMPISWQGWVITFVYVAVAIGASLLAERSMLAAVSILVPATILFVVIAFRTTAGGWGCRWGNRK